MTSLALALVLSALPTVTVTGNVLVPSGGAPKSGSVTCRLTTPGSASDSISGQVQEVSGEATATLTANTGAISMTLVPNDVITPSGTRYTCTYVATLASGRRIQWMRQWQLTSTPATQDIGSVPVPTYPLGATMPAATPTFSLSTGMAAPSDSLSIYANTPNSIIYYTTDGSTPTTSSNIYTMPIPLSVWSDETKTIQAVAAPLLGWSLSSVASVTLTIPWYSRLTTAGCYATPTTQGDASWAITRATTQTRDAGTVTCAANELAVETDGASIWKTTAQLYPTPTAPAAGSVTFTSTGSHIFWVRGTGSQTLSTGTATTTGLPCTATEAAPCSFSVTNLTTPVASLGAVTGSLTQAQIESRTYATPFMPTLGTRNTTWAIITPPTMGSVWCVSARAKATGRPWAIAGLTETVWSAGNVAAANSASVTLLNDALSFSVYDNAGAVKTITYTMAAATNSAHRIAACNESGTLSLWWDGRSVGSVTGAGTGTWGTQPSQMWIGGNSAANNAWNGNLSQFTICRQAASATACMNPTAIPSLVALGDSITYGFTISESYPLVASDLVGGYALTNYAVTGYTSTQILTTWTDTVRGTTPAAVILMGGTNDLLASASAASIWTNLKTIVDQAVADGATVYLGTVIPFGGWVTYNASKEAERQSLNTTIRAYCSTSTIKCYDADLALRDPGDATKMLTAYDSGDHLHPSQAGANAIATVLAALFP